MSGMIRGEWTDEFGVKHYLAIKATENGELLVSSAGGSGGGGGLTDAQLRATPLAVTGGLTATQLSALALATEATVLAIRNRLPNAFKTPEMLAVEPLGTPSQARLITTGSTSASVALTPACRRISMYSTAGAWYNFGAAATATSHYIAAGERLDLAVPASTTVHAIQESVAGSIRISELT